MAQPAFPHQQQSGARLDADERPELFGRVGPTGRSGHHQRQARVLEADRARPGGHFDVERAGNDAVRVDVSTVLPTGFQQIDPQAVEARLARKVERAFSGELDRVAGQQLGKVGEGRVALGQIVERGVAGVTGVAVLARPTAAGLVVLGKAADRVRQIGKQHGIVDLGFVELGDEQVAGHSLGCSLSATSLMKRASSPSASHSDSAAIAPSMSDKGSISDLA